MSDFKTIQDFRKGSISRFPYQDPTYLSFALLFNFHDPEHSPLLSGPAEAFLEKLSKGGGEDKFLCRSLIGFNNFYRIS